MAQFDVYPNPSKHQRADIPWIVDIQSDLLSALTTRLVVPLALRKHMPPALPRVLCPALHWGGETLVALPHMAAPIRIRDLGSPKGNLKLEASALAGAIDAVISGI
ncbi:CcdB family protein [Variovorax sp. RA8]|uniref:CcdB family protein n=1 Tax=Variovorax sp. (strain JCM 16519 / RA8) TaxID=662548 RepID=UPI001317FAD7|nr:CcdB family protein [Variovorax sp. RA8]VTU37617.1 plasmid maintenance protein CcdB [Variovorax sp. RA8]